MKWSGHFTALITPFVNDQLDEEGLLSLLHLQAEAGVKGVVLFGATGEGVLLRDKEKERIFSIAQAFKNRLLLVASLGGGSTQEVIERAHKMTQCGADALLIASPPYVKPTQEGLKRHFSAIAEVSSIPLILYDHPGRTIVQFQPETCAALAAYPHIIGLKASSPNLVHFMHMLLAAKKVRKDFAFFVGDDSLLLPMFSLGAKGIISVAGNLVPQQMQELVESFFSQNEEKARTLFERLFPLFEILAIETNPIPLKAALTELGLPAGSPRLPLTPFSSHLLPRLQEVLEELGLLALAGAKR